jgi:hypothetical protein
MEGFFSLLRSKDPNFFFRPIFFLTLFFRLRIDISCAPLSLSPKKPSVQLQLEHSEIVVLGILERIGLKKIERIGLKKIDDKKKKGFVL